jgi:hypothetical protein
MSLTVAYIGNFEPAHSTENDLLDTMQKMRVDVTPIQEQDQVGWQRLIDSLVNGTGPDVVLWTRTKSLSEQVPVETRRKMQIQARLSDVPTAGIHLDRWWGLSRQADLYDDPFFQCQYLFTADGHDPQRWAALGANHYWSPPAIALRNTEPGAMYPLFRSKIAFIGGWKNYGHTEWAHRPHLVQFLRDTYGDRVRFWPEENQPRIVPPMLNDLYASVDVIVGDSCLVPDPVTGEAWTNYCSDRVFETVGRGTLLIHPFVKGVLSRHNETPALLQSEKHCLGWELGDWTGLKMQIDRALTDKALRQRVAAAGRKWVLSKHLYSHRLHKVFNKVKPGWTRL